MARKKKAVRPFIAGGQPPTPGDFAAWEEGETLALASLDRLRATSVGWRNALSLSSGVLAGATLLGTLLGSSTSRPSDLVVWMGVTTAVILLGAVVFAARATSGWPKRAAHNEDQRVWLATETRATLGAFRASIWMSVAAGVLAIAAVAAAAFSQPTSNIRVDVSTGTTVCATRVDVDGQMFRLTIGDDVRLIPQAEVVSLTSGGC